MSEDAAAADGPGHPSDVEHLARDDSDDHSVGTLELFFDLVFVYAMAQVTQLMLNDVSWLGFGRGVLALGAVWWAWVCYAWLTNTSGAASVHARTLVFLAMAAMLIAAVALPQAFGEEAVLFGLAYFCVRLIHIALFLLSVGQDAALRSGILRLIPSLLAGPALVVTAAFVASPFRELLWVAAAVIDFGGPLVAGMGGFRVLPSYFVERHGLIIIIALGEALVEVAAGVTEELPHPEALVAAVLGVLISACLWWTYFERTSGAQRRLQGTRGIDRARHARDAYSYLHLPLVAGILFFALGVQEAIAAGTVPLTLLPAVTLGGGVALFFAADVAYRWLDHHQLATDRLIAAAASLVVIPLAMAFPALVSLGALTVIGVSRTAWEIWRGTAV